MQLLSSTPSPEDRPWGIAVLCGLLAAAAIAAFAFASLVIANAIPLSYGSVLLQGGLEQSGPIAFLIYGSVTLVLAVALWTRRGWARRLTILLAGVGVALGVPAISSAVVDGRPWSIARGGLQVMVRVAVIYYLSQVPVREWFASRHP